LPGSERRTIKASAKTWLLVITALTLIGVVLIFLVSPGQWLDERIDAEAMGQWIESQGTSGIVVFVIGGAMLTGIGMPRQLVALCAGYGFSLLEGLALAIVSVSCGALITFTFSRKVARPWVRQRYPDATNRVDSFIHNQPMLKIITIRLAPVGTNMLTNLAAGSTALPASVFFFASLIGFLPQTLIFVLIGSGLAIDSQQRLLVALALAVVSLLLCWFIYKRAKDQ